MMDLERRINKLRECPLLLICKTPEGQERQMTVRECIETGSAFIHVCMDDLDALLADELERR